MQPILIVCDKAPRIEAVVGPRFPELDFVHATKGDEVIRALEAHRPEVAFSLKHSEFPAEFHRPLIEFPSLRWIHVGGSGYEHFVPWEASRLTLSNSVGVLAPFLAETTVGAMLSLNGGLLRYARQQQEKQWKPNPFRTIQGQTLLVVGLGAIGEEVARLSRSLGMQVLGVRRTATPSAHVDELFPLDALPDLLPRADVVSVNIRASDQTRQLFNAEMFAQMRDGALFINTSRGVVVDETARVSALQSGHLGGAYLDVFETEPLPWQSPLWTMENVLVTPHTADQTSDYPERFAALFADNLEKWLAGQPMSNVLEG